MKLLFNLALFSLFYILYSIFYIPNVFAQTGLEVATTHQIEDESAVDGDILISTDQGMTRASSPYTPRIFGVLQLNPAIVLRDADETKLPIIRTGIAKVNVTNFNGTIKRGDFITSSQIVGKGQKATLSGYIIGVALEDLDETTAQSFDAQGKSFLAGRIAVGMRIEFAELTSARSVNRLLDNLNSAFFTNLSDPQGFNQTIRYIGAALIIALSLLVGLLTFARTIPKSVEAIGRNPLARTTIQLSIIMNIAFTLGLAIIGLVAAFILLRV